MARNAMGNNPLLSAQTHPIDDEEIIVVEFDLEKEKAELGITASTKTTQGSGKPKKEGLVRAKGSQKGLPADWTRATFIISKDNLARLSNYAAENRISKKEALNEILDIVLQGEKNREPTEEEKNQAKMERLKKVGLIK